MPMACIWYILPIAKEDRATLGSDPSALVMPYGMGRGPFWASSSNICRRPKSDKSKLKSMITYRKFNLMSPRYPLKVQLDFVFCRNVLIYFDNDDKRDIVTKFHQVIKPGGYIFIGHSESLMNLSTSFQLRHFQHDMVYQKPLGATPVVGGMR